MPHHIISPTPSQQGLGITYSTLPPSPAPSQSSTPPRFTGLGAGARSSPTRPSFIRGTQQLFQPTFSLRATHTSNTSVKGFTTFSAIPPSPMGPRSPARLPLPLSSTVTSESEHIPEFLEHREDRRLPSRRGSVASNATSTSRTPKKSKSSELLGRFSKNDTVSFPVRRIPIPRRPRPHHRRVLDRCNHGRGVPPSPPPPRRPRNPRLPLSGRHQAPIRTLSLPGRSRCLRLIPL
jgi:hypothetical protein